MSLPLPSIGGILGLVDGLAIAFGVTGLLALLLLPSLMIPGAKPAETTKALYRYMLQGIGAVFMTLSGLPALFGVITNRALPANGYLALLLIFIFGGLIYLWNESHMEKLDEASRLVPSLIFRYAFKFISFFSLLAAVTSIVSTMLFSSWPYPDYWWGSPVVFLCYGLFLGWCTHVPKATKSRGFQAVQMRKTSPHHGLATAKSASHAKKKR